MFAQSPTNSPQVTESTQKEKLPDPVQKLRAKLTAKQIPPEIRVQFQNPKNEDQWAYWEREPGMLPSEEVSITQEDHDDRVGKIII